jgi:hypothetical protein
LEREIETGSVDEDMDENDLKQFKTETPIKKNKSKSFK